MKRLRALRDRFYRKFNVISDLPPWHLPPVEAPKPPPEPPKVRRKAPTGLQPSPYDDFLRYNNLLGERGYDERLEGHLDGQMLLANVHQAINERLEQPHPNGAELFQLTELADTIKRRLGELERPPAMAREYTAEEIAKMSPEEYARVRGHLLSQVRGHLLSQGRGKFVVDDEGGL